MKKLWQLRNNRCLGEDFFSLVGIVNITPDSFSDGFLNPKKALDHSLRLLDEGAAILDLGAESTRPFADPVPENEEIQRLLPVLTALRQERPDAILSIDTFKAGTAQKALQAGADILNDISACRDPALLDVLVQFQPGYVLMHSQGTPKTMQIAPSYENIVQDILKFFEEQMNRLTKAGFSEEHIVLDPGIGFGKTADHCVEILQNIRVFHTLGRPLYVGLSRKSFFGTLLNIPLNKRDEATYLATALLATQGVQYHRVHDVAGSLQALQLVKLLMRKKNHD